MQMSDIQWIKQALIDNKADHKELIAQAKLTNGTVRTHSVQIAELNTKQKSHFHFHRYKMNMKKHIETMSRGKVAILISIINILTIVFIAIVMR